MTPVTSPNRHSPVKPSPGVHPTAEGDESKSDISEIEDYESHQQGCREDKSYNPDFVEIDDTYDHNIQIPLTFTNGAVPESMCATIMITTDLVQ